MFKKKQPLLTSSLSAPGRHVLSAPNADSWTLHSPGAEPNGVGAGPDAARAWGVAGGGRKNFPSGLRRRKRII